jgi:prophage regulatory protein
LSKGLKRRLLDGVSPQPLLSPHENPPVAHPPTGAGANVACPLPGGHSPNGQRCLRLNAVCDKAGLRETALRKRVAEGTFPAPFKIGQRAIAWLEADVDAWIADRAAKRLMFKA